ncbi:MAG TPA: hypothetical protein VKW06_00175 [Candidatus Angelobacter sp.]|nr:hypothetical protein [Candidatus Angelobacter sp.]
MSASQVLDRTFYLYRKHFVLFAGIAVAGPALSLVASFIQLGIFGKPIMLVPGQPDPAILQDMLQKLVVQTMASAILVLIFYTIGQAIATGATVYAVSMVHLGKDTSIAECYQSIKPTFWRILRILLAIYVRMIWPLVIGYTLFFILTFAMLRTIRAGVGGAQAGAILAIFAGFIFASLAIVGGLVWMVYVYCRYSLAIPACALEKLSAQDALARSRSLVAGSMGRIVGIYLLTIVMAAVLASVLQLPAFFSMNIFTMKPGDQVSAAFMFWSLLGGFLGRILAGPIATVAIALVYYDQRVRKEAFDLQLMMDAIGQPATPPPPPLANPAAPGIG